jgi:NAD(P)-dependent dehydrogenase (short-subunit alcohol dehydrogenase family)
VGGGCRGLALTRSLAADGHAVRVVTRGEERRAEIEEAGGECWIGDPDRIGTLRYALANVTILLWALDTVAQPELHGSRLEMMLERTIDTMVRGVIYEGRAGAGIVERMCRLNELPYALLDADPADAVAWTAAGRAEIDPLLFAQRPTVR